MANQPLSEKEPLLFNEKLPEPIIARNLALSPSSPPTGSASTATSKQPSDFYDTLWVCLSSKIPFFHSLIIFYLLSHLLALCTLVITTASKGDGPEEMNEKIDSFSALCLGWVSGLLSFKRVSPETWDVLFWLHRWGWIPKAAKSENLGLSRDRHSAWWVVPSALGTLTELAAMITLVLLLPSFGARADWDLNLDWRNDWVILTVVYTIARVVDFSDVVVKRFQEEKERRYLEDEGLGDGIV